MFEKFKYGLQRMMTGRNGTDVLGLVSLCTGVICSLLSSIPKLRWLTLLAFVCLAYSIFRMYSRNVTRRREENARFVGFFRQWRARLTDHDHRYFRCPQCHQTVRVPKGKGKLKIRCPKCQTQFEKKS